MRPRVSSVKPILSKIDWKRVNGQTRRQVRNREVHCPPISLFRWWARRPHSLVAALLKESGLRPGALVSDPFSGGGTVTIEAAKLGFDVYAQDLNPWPVWGLRSALDSVSSVSVRPSTRLTAVREG
jgi:putative DNA methylase